MRRWNIIGVIPLVLAGLLAGALQAQPAVGEYQLPAKLFTKPDASATGGIRGEIINPGKPIEFILAMPPDEPNLAYAGQVTGDDRRGFLFEGLPMGRYNLFVIYASDFYEGLELTRGPDTLTESDRGKIYTIIEASDRFMNKKVLHRAEGTTGRGNLARAVITEYRDKPAVDGGGKPIPGFRRTFKLVWLKDVGVGWQVVQKRDLYPITVPPGKPALLNPPHHYSAALSKIRVTDAVKDLGKLDLEKQKSRPVTADPGE